MADAVMFIGIVAGWAFLRAQTLPSYHDYLNSYGWRITKYLRKRDKCQRCGTRKRLQLHHHEYIWHNKHNRLRGYIPNLWDRMETLCDYHHGKVHGK